MSTATPSPTPALSSAASRPPVHAVWVYGVDDSRTHELLTRLQARGIPTRRVAQDERPPIRGQTVQLAVVVCPPNGAGDTRLLADLCKRHQPTLVWGGPCVPAQAATGGAEWLDASSTVDEVVGCVRTLAQYAPRVRRLETEVDQLQRLGQQVNRYFGEIDQEMRLAGRLQRDFLPRELTMLPGVTLSAVYRPASWVSGDIYDACALDDEHVGVLVADAMGHGVAAGLMTMFLRHTMVARRQAADHGHVLKPSAVLGELHESLCRQKLPNCQFVTAAYGVLNHRTLELRIARAGHPSPVLIRRGREADEIIEVPVTGGLLGLADIPPDFQEVVLPLRPGDKLLLYTDGLEDVLTLPRQRRDEPLAFAPLLQDWARLSAPDLAAAVHEHLDRQAGSLHPADDVTLLALEITGFRSGSAASATAG